jgi:hypothetical protein
LGPVKIGANILGGLVNSGGKIAAVTIGGSIVGGSITSSGVVSAGGAIGMVKIGGDLQASTISFTGLVFSGGDIAGVTVGGSVIGANGNSAVSVYDEGGIVADGNLGPVSIAHDLIGGKNTNTHDSIYTGVVEAGLRITSVTIGGNIVSGTNSNTGTLENSGAIIAGDDLGSLTVKGSLIGNAGVGHGATPVEIVARGQHTQGANTDVAIGKITVAHRVEHAQILAGYDTSLTPVNADAQIGAVTVGGDWIASDLIAGAYNKGADHMQGGSDDNINFGNADDTIIAGGSAGIMSKIASVTIQGALLGTPVSTNNTDNFGFVAQQIGSIKVGGGAIAIPTNNTPLAVGETSDVDIHIIP